MAFWSATREVERLQESETSHSPGHDSIPASESDHDSNSESDDLEDPEPDSTFGDDFIATSTGSVKKSSGDTQSMSISPDKTLEPSSTDTQSMEIGPSQDADTNTAGKTLTH